MHLVEGVAVHDRRRRGLDVSDEMRPPLVAGFRHVHLVADPGGRTLLGEMHVGVVGRGNPQQRGRETLGRRPPADPQGVRSGCARSAACASLGGYEAEGLHPHLPQQRDRRDLAQPCRRIRGRDGAEQHVPVAPDLLGVGAPFDLAAWDMNLVS